MSGPTKIADGTVVVMHYKLTNADGELLDSSEGDDPLSYLHGAGNIVPGLENKLTGKKVGDKVEAIVPPSEGYGEPEGAGPQPISLDQFPEDIQLEEGMMVHAQSPDGESFPLWVTEVRETEVMMDSNHPLAGVTLNFKVEIMEIREASKEEKAHGHPHGPGGHHH